MVLSRGLPGVTFLEKPSPGPVLCGSLASSALLVCAVTIADTLRGWQVETSVMIRSSVPTYSRSISHSGCELKCEVGITCTGFYHQFVGLELLSDP